jgi:biopolymer transport protein ExbB/TolQ
MYWIIAAILGLMSVYLVLAIGRALRYAIADAESSRLHAEVTEALEIAGIDEAIRVCHLHKVSILARLTGATLCELKSLKTTTRQDVERAAVFCGRARAWEMAAIKRGMPLLKTICQTGALLGFLAAAVDMASAFDNLAELEGSSFVAFSYESGAAMRFAVAGMMISLVAIFTHKYIASRIERDALEAERSSHELINLCWRHRGAVRRMEKIRRAGLQIWESKVERVS